MTEGLDHVVRVLLEAQIPARPIIEAQTRLKLIEHLGAHREGLNQRQGEKKLGLGSEFFKAC